MSLYLTLFLTVKKERISSAKDTTEVKIIFISFSVAQKQFPEMTTNQM